MCLLVSSSCSKHPLRIWQVPKWLQSFTVTVHLTKLAGDSSCCSARTFTICIFRCAVTVQDFLNRYEIGATVGVGGDIQNDVWCDCSQFRAICSYRLSTLCDRRVCCCQEGQGQEDGSARGHQGAIHTCTQIAASPAACQEFLTAWCYPSGSRQVTVCNRRQQPAARDSGPLQGEIPDRHSLFDSTESYQLV